jgi:hypothetical protein
MLWAFGFWPISKNLFLNPISESDFAVLQDGRIWEAGMLIWRVSLFQGPTLKYIRSLSQSPTLTLQIYKKRHILDLATKKGYDYDGHSIVNVWAHNLREEIVKIQEIIDDFPYVALVSGAYLSVGESIKCLLEEFVKRKAPQVLTPSRIRSFRAL